MCHMNQLCFLQHSPSQQADGRVNGYSNAVQVMKKSIHIALTKEYKPWKQTILSPMIKEIKNTTSIVCAALPFPRNKNNDQVSF